MEMRTKKFLWIAAAMTMLTATEVKADSTLTVNEIMVSNVDEYVSPSFNFDGWIELYNPADEAVNIGNYYFSDDAAEPLKWHAPSSLGTVPAKGFKVVWFDSNDICGTNASFKLDTDGGVLIISDSNGKEVLRQTYPKGIERAAYARTTDNGDDWAYTSTPTPGKSNEGALFANSQLPEPEVSQPSQLFKGVLQVKVDIPEGYTLRYTNDGTLPTLTNGTTNSTGVFYVSSNRSLRLRYFADGYLPSNVVSRSYILNDKNYTLPIISVIGDPDFLYGDSLGVMVKGVNGKPGNGQSDKCNWNMNWERPVNFSYISIEDGMLHNQDANLEMCGGWSRAWEPHSFKLKGNKELGGDKNLKYPFFSAKPYIRNRTLQIRNGGNDTQCRVKDPFLETIIQTSGIDIDLQSYQPVHEFINGKYIGVLNMREPNNKHFVYANHGYSDDEIDQFEVGPDSGYTQKCGTKEAFTQLVKLSAEASSNDTYEEIRRLLDTDEFINYCAMEMFMGSSDWMRNNVKGWRPKDNGRFRFVSFDLDFAFKYGKGMFNYIMGMEKNYRFDKLYPSGNYITADIECITLLKQLFNNADFKRRFIDTYCIMGGSVFEVTRANSIIDSLTAIVKPALALENASPSSTVNSMKKSLSSRNSTMIGELKRYSPLGLKNITARSATLNSNVASARIEINGINVPCGYFKGSLFAPVKLKAVAPAGYVFLGWKDNSSASATYYSTSSEVSMPTSSTFSLTATYREMSETEKAAAGITPVRINEVCPSNGTHVNEYGKTGDWVELYNTTSSPVDVEGMYLSNDPADPQKYKISKDDTNAATVIPANGYLLIWCDKRQTTDAGLHAPFKLSAAGNAVLLTASDLSWADTLYYSSAQEHTTIGRYPDGGSDIYVMTLPTIGKSNILNTYCTVTDQSALGISEPIASASDFRMLYADGGLLIRGIKTNSVQVSIYTTDGQLIMQTSAAVSGGEAQVSAETLPQGFYIAKANDGKGNITSCKFTK